MNSFPKYVINVFFSFLLIFAGVISLQAQELKAEEVIAKHLESIGTKEKRAEVKNQLAGGISQFESKMPSKKTGGKVVIVSDSGNLFLVSSFNSQEYPFEKIGYFKEKVALPFVTAGTRSPLGAFLIDHNKLLSEGLLGGSVSSRWALLNSQRKGRFTSAGTKKIDGRKAYALNYSAENIGSFDFTVKMFFDAENFQHLRSEYRRTVAPREEVFGRLGTQTGVKIALIENFGDYKVVNGLTLPHSYKISYMTESNSGTYEYEWNFAFTQYIFNQNLAADFFKFDDK